MQKIYQRINWENYPSENTPLNESNLNRMDYAVNELDNRILGLDTGKATVEQISTLVESIVVNDTTGEITITRKNGSTQTIQTTLNKIAINFAYDYATQTLILTLNDGTEARIDLSTLIQNNEFDSTSTINFTVTQTGHVSATIVEHSIGDEHLRTDYLSDIRVSESNASQSEQSADSHRLRSEAWATGKQDGTDVSPSDQTYHNNSKYWKQRAEAWAVGKVDGVEVEEPDETFENNSKYYSQVSSSIRDATQAIRDDAESLLQSVTDRLTGLNMMVNYADGCLYYDINSGIRLIIDDVTGNLLYEIVV